LAEERERERDLVFADEEAAEEEEGGQGGNNDCVADHDMRDDARKESYEGAAIPDIGGRRKWRKKKGWALGGTKE
jgi:hypothetical protein